MKDDLASQADDELQALREEVERLRSSELASQAAEEWSRRILDAAVVGIVQIGHDGRIIYANAHARKLIAATNHELTEIWLDDLPWSTIYPDGTTCGFEDFPATKCLRTGLPQPPTTIGVQVSPDRVFWGLYTAVPVPDLQTGEPSGVMVTFVDVGAQQRVEESLRQSEERYRRLVEQAPDAIVVHRNRMLVYVNDAAVKLWGGESRENLIGRDIINFVHPRYQEQVKDRIDQTLRGAVTPLVDQLHVRLDGRIVPIEVTATPCIYDGHTSVQVILRDISQRKRTERQVRRQREILRKFFNRIPAVVCFINVKGRITSVNREWKRVLGWGKELPIWELLEKIYPDSEQRQRATDRLHKSAADWADFRVRAKNGQTLDICWAQIELSDGTRIAIGQDVTRRKAAEEALRQSKVELEGRVLARTEELWKKNVELESEVSERRKAESELHEKQRFLKQLLNGHERDRQLVAYEIHDSFLQDVIGALMYIDAHYDARLPAADDDLERLERARLLLREAIDEARRMISGLRPPIIDEQGVVASIEYLASEMKSRNRVVRFDHAVEVERLEPLLEATIFRIVQEALTNFERHSGSEYAEVSITQAEGIIRLEIRDFGTGFDPARVGEGHFGLQGIRERVRLVGGAVSINSSPGEGTQIVTEIPILRRDASSLVAGQSS